MVSMVIFDTITWPWGRKWDFDREPRHSHPICRMSNTYIQEGILLLAGDETVLLVSEHSEPSQTVPGFVLQLGSPVEFEIS
jgi:hypothetical protein